jgi:hypothetical protein
MRSQAEDINGAVHACAEAELGDVRRTKRLGELADVLAQHPTAALPAACGDGAMLNAASRFCSHDDIAPKTLLSSPSESTSSRRDLGPLGVGGARDHRRRLDGPSCDPRLGALGHTAGLASRPASVPSTLAFTPARVPLGLLAQHVWARDPEDVGKRKRRKPLPIRQQESQQGLTRLEAVCHARDGCAPTRFVSGGDRAADVFDLLAAARPEGVALLVRAAWDRGVEVPGALGGPRVRRNRLGSTSACRCPVVARSPAAQPRGHGALVR